jgi:DNA-binding transcriptional MerR regulator
MKRLDERSRSSLQLFEADPALAYSIDVAERLTRVPRRKILIYCRHRLVSPVTDREFGGYYFSSDAIRTLRLIGYLDGTHSVNLAGIKIILNLADELQRLRAMSVVHPLATQPTRSMAKK